MLVVRGHLRSVSALLVVLAGVLSTAGAADCVGVVANEAFKPGDFERCAAVTVGDASRGVRVHVFWTILGRGTKDEEITLAAQFPSDRGWVAIGLSESGSMYGSDIFVVRKPTGGIAVAEDRFARSSVTPTLDAVQDVTLVATDASSGTTSIVIKRPTKTCHSTAEDIDFTDVLTAVIVAWGEDHEFAYHSPGRRATGWLNFFDLPTPENTAGLLTHEVRGNTLQVPVDKTVYCYSGHKLPQDKKYHVVRAEAFLNSSHPQLVHHMILYTCLQDLDETFYNQTQTGPPVCAVGMKQKGMCYSFWILWAVGGNAMQMPNEAGMPMGLSTIPGDVSTARNVMLEVHYDNPDGVQITDSSGFKLYYTDKLRDNDAVIMTLGHMDIDIPPGAVSHEHINECSGACTSKMKGPITALWAGLHMHAAGKGIWTQHFRGLEELPRLGHKASWDFNQQSPSHVKAVIKPGDRLVTHCTYNSESSTQRKTFGEGSDDEMCFNFLLVYPAESVPFMCIDLADLAGTSSGQGTPRMGICLTQDSQQELAGVLDFGMGGGRDVNVLDSLNSLGKMTIPFDAAPSDAVAPYLTLQCAAKVTTLSSSGTYLAASSCLYLLAACCSLLILSH